MCQVLEVMCSMPDVVHVDRDCEGQVVLVAREHAITQQQHHSRQQEGQREEEQEEEEEEDEEEKNEYDATQRTAANRSV